MNNLQPLEEKNGMRYGSLCTGIGGFDMGLDAAGFECVWQVEIDPKCRQVLANHWPNVKRFNDMKEVGEHNLDTVDILAGGPPCQSFSVAGHRKGLGDDRGNLTLEFVRICDELQPRIILFENVPGILSDKTNAFGCLLAGLVGADSPLVVSSAAGGRWADAGMVIGPKRCAAWCIKDAQFFGVPQRRRRVFLVAGASAECVSEILFKSEGVCGDSAEGREAGQSIAAAIGDSFAGIGGGLHGHGAGFVGGGLGTLAPESGCLTPWLPQRQRIHAAVGVCEQCRANSNGGGHGVPTLAIGGMELLNGIEHESGQVSAHCLRAQAALSHRADSDNLVIAVSTEQVDEQANGVVVYDARGNGNGSIAPPCGATANSGVDDYCALALVPAVCYDMTHADDVIREIKTGIVPTLQARMGTGGNQRNLVAACSPSVFGRTEAIYDPSPTVTSKWAKGSGGPAGDECQNLVMTLLPCEVIPFAQNTREEVRELGNATASLGAQPGMHQQTFLALNTQGSGTDDSGTVFAVQEDNQNGVCERDTTGSLRASAPSHQPCGTLLRSGMAIRRLTPTECERLQGFPDEHTAFGRNEATNDLVPMSDSARYKQCGNAVNVAVATWIGFRIREALDNYGE